MSDEPSAPKRKKSRRKMRRITVPGDDVPRAANLEEDVDLDADEQLDDGDDTDEAFDDEPTDPNVFKEESESGRRSSVPRASVLPPEGGSFRNDSVVVSRSRIISDRPSANTMSQSPVLPPPPMIDDLDDPVVEQYTMNADEEEEESRPTLHAEPPSGPIRMKTPPPPPGASIMIAADYAQEVDELNLRQYAEDTLPHSLRPSTQGAAPGVTRSSRPSNRPSAPPRDNGNQSASASPPAARVDVTRSAAASFPEHTTGPRVSAPPSVPAEARTGPRGKADASMKPTPPAPPRKILTPVPPAPNKPPPPPPKEQGKKSAPPWWKTFFSDDYLRSVIAHTPAQVKRQCDFVESVLGLPRGATILDVGCGTGLQAIELTERGYLVVGLDLSLPMITRAAEEAQYRNLRINFLHTDIREIQFDGAFDAVICLGTTFGFFDEDSNRNVLGRLRDALKPGGRFLLDVVNRDHVIRSQPNLVWFQGDGCVCMEESEFNYFTSRLQVKRTMMHEDGRQSDAEYSLRLYSLHEIGQLLSPLGFRVIEVSGQAATRGVFFGGDSTRIITLAERRGTKTDAEGAKAEAGRVPQKSSLKPPPPAKPEATSTSRQEQRDSSDDLTELVEEVSAPHAATNTFDDEEATDPNVRLPTSESDE